MTIKIGPIELENNVILAPMSGVSDMPYRRLAKRFGAGLVISEMIASQAMIYANRKTMKMASNCAEEFPMAVQLAGCEPALMAEALGEPINALGPRRAEIINKGMIYSPAHGDIDFTVPMFDEYLRRVG